MKTLVKPTVKSLRYAEIADSKAYDQFLEDSYVHVPPQIQELELPAVRILAVSGNEPPASQQYQAAIAALYGVGYGLRMGLKFESLPRPNAYFDYKVGALGSLWWSAKTNKFDISDPKTLRWKAYLLLPPFVQEPLFREAVAQAKTKHPETSYDEIKLELVNEGRCVQILHVGPYNAETPTIEKIQSYLAEHRLVMNGAHDEIYISDPRRTPSERLRTVIRWPVKEAS